MVHPTLVLVKSDSRGRELRPRSIAKGVEWVYGRRSGVGGRRSVPVDLTPAVRHFRERVAVGITEGGAKLVDCTLNRSDVWSSCLKDD